MKLKFLNTINKLVFHTIIYLTVSIALIIQLALTIGLTAIITTEIYKFARDYSDEQKQKQEQLELKNAPKSPSYLNLNNEETNDA